MKNKHRRSKKNIFDNNFFLIHVLRLRLICIQRWPRFQTKKEGCFYFHEKHSSPDSPDHFKSFQNHRRRSFRRRITSFLHIKSNGHCSVRRHVQNHHQLSVFFYQNSKNSIRPTINFGSNGTSKKFLRSTRLFSQVRNQIRGCFQSRSTSVENENPLRSSAMNDFFRDHHS